MISAVNVVMVTSISIHRVCRDFVNKFFITKTFLTSIYKSVQNLLRHDRFSLSMFVVIIFILKFSKEKK